MTEKELIAKIQKLKQIEPDQGWVLTTKTQILGETLHVRSGQATPFFGFFPQTRLVLASFLVFVLLTSFSLAQNSLPGDLLYPLKKLSEQGQQVFVSEEEKPRAQLELANKRLEELSKVANQARKLAPAIEEFEASVSRAAQDLAQAKEPNVREIAKQAKKLEENKQKIRSLGVVAETEELDNALAQLVEREIKDLEDRTLNTRQQEILEMAKDFFEAGNYSQALEKILILSYPQE